MQAMAQGVMTTWSMFAIHDVMLRDRSLLEVAPTLLAPHRVRGGILRHRPTAVPLCGQRPVLSWPCGWGRQITGCAGPCRSEV